jgi:ornithine cyclodeaminase
MSALPWLDAATIARALSMRAAVDALERALLDGLDPAGGPPRTVVTTRAGQLLLMPAEAGSDVGIKLVAVAPGNAGRGRPTVQGVYVLLDGDTLTPVALLDGAALTSLRTPAVSAVAVAHLAAPEASRLVVFGTGPQAWGHVEAVAAVRPVTQVSVVGRDARRTAEFVERLAEQRLPANAVAPLRHVGLAAADTSAVAAAVAAAHVVVCATRAGTPLFDGGLVRDRTCVVAVGTHAPDRRELDAQLLGRSHVVVEDSATAMREAGDVVLAVDEGALTAGGSRAARSARDGRARSLTTTVPGVQERRHGLGGPGRGRRRPRGDVTLTPRESTVGGMTLSHMQIARSPSVRGSACARSATTRRCLVRPSSRSAGGFRLYTAPTCHACSSSSG